VHYDKSWMFVQYLYVTLMGACRAQSRGHPTVAEHISELTIDTKLDLSQGCLKALAGR